jgi:drug/metabolite transporter (DMT)-like permease
MTQLLNQNWQVYASLLYMAICGSVLAYIFWNYGITHLGARPTSLFFNLVPIVTSIVSVILGQRITLLEVTGVLIVLVGVLLSTSVIRLPKFTPKPI